MSDCRQDALLTPTGTGKAITQSLDFYTGNFRSYRKKNPEESLDSVLSRIINDEFDSGEYLIIYDPWSDKEDYINSFNQDLDIIQSQDGGIYIIASNKGLSFSVDREIFSHKFFVSSAVRNDDGFELKKTAICSFDREGFCVFKTDVFLEIARMDGELSAAPVKSIAP